MQHSWQYPGNGSSFPGRRAACLPAIPPPCLVSGCCVPLPPPCSPRHPLPRCCLLLQGLQGPWGLPRPGQPAAGLAALGAMLGTGQLLFPSPGRGKSSVSGKQSSSRAQGRWQCLPHLPLHQLLPAHGAAMASWCSSPSDGVRRCRRVWELVGNLSPPVCGKGCSADGKCPGSAGLGSVSWAPADAPAQLLPGSV